MKFAYKDLDGNKSKVMTLEATESIRRFLLHILPRGFVRIRQFGFLADRARRKKLELYGGKVEPQDAERCPACRIGLPPGCGKTMSERRSKP